MFHEIHKQISVQRCKQNQSNPIPDFKIKFVSAFRTGEQTQKLNLKNIWLYRTERYKNSKFFLNPWYPVLILLTGMAHSICSSKRRLQKQGRNAAILPSHQYLAICGLHSSCAETVPAGLTTLVEFSTWSLFKPF